MEQGFSEARAAYGNRQPKKKKRSTPDNSPRSQAEGGAAASAAYGGSKDGDQALAGAAYEAPDYGVSLYVFRPVSGPIFPILLYTFIINPYFPIFS